jgi:hypothetical protein
LLIALLLFPSQIRATTVVVFIFPDGVVISSDSKTVHRDSAYQSTGESYQAKLVILQNRIVVAAIGTSDIKDPIHHSHYNFLDWIQALRATMPESISVDNAAELIERESSKTFALFALGDSLKNGTIRNEVPVKLAHYPIVGLNKAGINLDKISPLRLPKTNVPVDGPSRRRPATVRSNIPLFIKRTTRVCLRLQSVSWAFTRCTCLALCRRGFIHDHLRPIKSKSLLSGG